MKKDRIINNLIANPETKLKSTIPVVKFRAPNKREFIRAKPLNDDGREIVLGFLQENKKPFEVYMVTREIYTEFIDICFLAKPVIAINRQNDIFIWPLKIKKHHINFAAQKHAEMATTTWTAKKLHDNRYELVQPSAPVSQPRWPNLSENMILDLAAKNYSINDLDHPVIKQLLGYF